MATRAVTPLAHVLVAESDRRTSDIVSWLLREQGYAVDTIDAPGELLPRLDRIVPDLVLLDGDAPDAQRLLDQLRADDRFRDLRLIVATTTPTGTSLPAFPQGADDCVAKPYRVLDLAARVRTQLRARGELIEVRETVTLALDRLERAREASANAQQIVDILHDVTGELSASEIYRVLTRRVARALSVSHCSVILARAGDAVGTVVAAFEDPSLGDLELRLDDYPEITAALDSERSVLVEDSDDHPLFEAARRRWTQEGRENPVRSVIMLPFMIDHWRRGVLFIRTERDERELTTDDVRFAERVLRGAVAAIRRVQALETTRADNRRLEALATTDPLTRVLNRRALLDRLSIEVDRASRFNATLTLLLIDVDYFKLINDTAGHAAGDDVLRQLAALLEEAVRRVDIVARYGGEEFVVILPETSEEGGRVFAERLRERVATRTFDVGRDRPLHLTVSIGVATFPSPRVETTEDLFARADEGLYRAKSGGRNMVGSTLAGSNMVGSN